MRRYKFLRHRSHAGHKLCDSVHESDDLTTNPAIGLNTQWGKIAGTGTCKYLFSHVTSLAPVVHASAAAAENVSDYATQQSITTGQPGKNASMACC